MWEKRAAQFVRYINKVYGFNKFLAGYGDSRFRPQIPAWVTTLTLLLGLWQRSGSLHQLEQMGRDGELDRYIAHPRKPSADTLGKALRHADANTLWEYVHSIVRKARRNKAFPQGTLAGWLVASLDGTEQYATSRPPEAARETWSKRARSNGKVEHYERMIAASYVGCQPRLQLGLERIRPGENERSASLRLIDELDRYHGPGWCDILCLDAGFVSAPFINALRVRHKHAVVKVKREDMLVVREAKLSFADRAPDVTMKQAVCMTSEERECNKELAKSRYDVRIWDADACVMWSGLDEPIRCLRVEETRWVRAQSEWVAEESVTYHIVTTMPQAIIRPETVWTIMHRRWDIENSLFNDLKQNWHFSHCYTHDVEGIEAMNALYAIARNLLLLFRYRGIRPRQGMTLKTLTRQICRGLLEGRASSVLRLDSG